MLNPAVLLRYQTHIFRQAALARLPNNSILC